MKLHEELYSHQMTSREGGGGRRRMVWGEWEGIYDTLCSGLDGSKVEGVMGYCYYLMVEICPLFEQLVSTGEMHSNVSDATFKAISV